MQGEQSGEEKGKNYSLAVELKGLGSLYVGSGKKHTNSFFRGCTHLPRQEGHPPPCVLCIITVMQNTSG